MTRHLLGYVSTAARHAGRSWAYYLPVLAGGGFPWVFYLASAAREQWRRPKDAGSPASDSGSPPHDASRMAVIAVWTWLGGGLLFLSIAQVKLWTYALPLFPAAALLAAQPWSRVLRSAAPLAPTPQAAAFSAQAPSLDAPMRWTVAIHATLGALLLPAALIFGQRYYGASPSIALYGGTAIVTIGYWLAVRELGAGRSRAGFAALVTLFVATIAIALASLMPAVASSLSEKDLAAHFNAEGRMPAQLWLLDDRVGSLVFYLQPAIRRGLTPARVESMNLATVRERLPAAPPDTMVAVRERRAPALVRALNLEAVPYLRAGQFRLYPASALRQASGPPALPAD